MNKHNNPFAIAPSSSASLRLQRRSPARTRPRQDRACIRARRPLLKRSSTAARTEGGAEEALLVCSATKRGRSFRRATMSPTRTRWSDSSRQYDVDHELVADGDAKFTLEVGDDLWPLPIPIVKVGDQWTYDIDAGIDEIVYRRIGRNEIGAIQACRGVVDAQTEYASESRDGVPAGTYAQKLVSDKGKHNGLYWPAQPGERASPVGPFIASASAEGYK